MQRKINLILISILFIISGTAGLIYELVWTRMLVLIFGNTLFAVSTVLSSFMAGLAIGSYFFGRYIDKKKTSLIKLYAVLELGIGLFALAFPLILHLVGPAYVGIYQGLSDNIILLNSIRFLICFLLILIPTCLMGATLPILVKYITDRSIPLGNRAGLLYGLNTLGAVIGCVVCGFVLLKTVGMQVSSFIAVGLNIGVALFAWVLSIQKKSQAGPVVKETLETKPAPPKDIQAERLPRKAIVIALIAVGISGFCSLSYEVFWSRMLTLFFRNTVYSFTTILATFLTGIALGSLIYYRFLSHARRQLLIFSILEIIIGVTSYMTPYLFATFHEILFSKPDAALIFVKSAAIMLIPTVLMGIAVPLAINICQLGDNREGASVGRVYAVNTLGSIIGPIFAGFIFIPLIGIHRSVNIVVGLNLAAGIILFFSTRKVKVQIISVVISAVTLVALFYSAPADLFRRLYQKTQPHAEILTYKEGIIANVVVYDFWKEGYKDLYLNGVEEASSRLWHVQLFKMLGILPALVHENPDNALMIAFGAGMSAGASIDLVESLDCVELNPDIEEVADIFKHENRDVYNNQKFNFILNDGRNQLLLSPEKYSVIISDATNPMSFDSWTLYSKEFYELCKNRLKPNGVFCQWVPMPLTDDALKVILKTFKSVFPHTSFWVIHGSSQCMMLATPERLNIDYKRLKQKLTEIYETSGLKEYAVYTVDKFLSFFFLGEDQLDSLLKDFHKTSTDDLPHAQFYGALDDAGIQTSLDLVKFQESVEPYLSNLGDQSENTHHTLEGYLQVSKLVNLGFLKQDRLEHEKARFFVSGTKLEDDENIKCMLKYDHKRKQYFQEWIKSHPDDHNSYNTLGYIYLMEKNYHQAIELLKRAVVLKPNFSNAHFNLALAYMESGQLDLAVKKWLEIKKINPTSATLQAVKIQLGIAYLKRKLRYQPTDELLRKRLAGAYLNYGNPVKALETFKKVALSKPEHPEKLAELASIYVKLGIGRREFDTRGSLQRSKPVDKEANQPDIRKYLPDAGVQFYRLNPNVTADGLDSRKEVEIQLEQAIKKWDTFEFDGKVSRTNLEMVAQDLEQLIELDSKFMPSYIEAATVYEMLGKYDKAASILRDGLLVSPGYKIAEFHIRRLELLKLLATTKEKDQQLAGLFGELGVLSMEVGDVEVAIEYMKKAHEMSPQDGTLSFFLGLAHITTGKYEISLDYFKQALKNDPDMDNAKQHIEILKNILTPSSPKSS